MTPRPARRDPPRAPRLHGPRGHHRPGTERGLGAATYRSVAELADVPLGSMTYHFPTRDDLVFAAFERFAQVSFSSLDDAVVSTDAEPRERLVRLVVTDSPGRQRDRVLLAELYVLAFRDERYAELMRRWARRAKDAIERQIHGVNGHVVDAVQEGMTLQRSFLPEEFSEDVMRRTLSALLPDGTTPHSDHGLAVVTAPHPRRRGDPSA